MSGIFSSMFQSGGTMRTPSRITMVVQPCPPTLMPSSRCSMPLTTLSATPVTSTACWNFPTTDPSTVMSRGTMGIWDRNDSPALVMVMPVCLISMKPHSFRVSMILRMLPSPTPTSSASLLRPMRLPLERTCRVQ